MIGFSLGGNFSLRAAAQTKRSLKLQRVMACCPLIHAKKTDQALQLRANYLYQTYFVRKWKIAGLKTGLFSRIRLSAKARTVKQSGADESVFDSALYAVF